MRLEGDLEAEERTATALRCDELEHRLQRAISTGKTIAIAIWQFDDLLDRNEEPARELFASNRVVSFDKRQAITSSSTSTTGSVITSRSRSLSHEYRTGAALDAKRGNLSPLHHPPMIAYSLRILATSE
jgi:hypothetical protein